MPIDIDEFEAADPEQLFSSGPSTKSDVLEFLAFTPENAYTRQEIHAHSDSTLFEVASVLRDLEADGLVRNKARYWIITDKGKAVARR